MRPPTLQTLIDPDKRAAYDSIAGFTPDAINPFKDTAYPRDLVGLAAGWWGV